MFFTPKGCKLHTGNDLYDLLGSEMLNCSALIVVSSALFSGSTAQFSGSSALFSGLSVLTKG